MANKAKDKFKGKKKDKKNILQGKVFIVSSFNNCIISATDPQGNVIAWSSAGVCGFKGARKGTPFAAQSAAEDVAKKAREHGLRNVKVYVSGPGSGRETAIRSLQVSGLELTLIKDISPLPHNGCRAPKKRRV